jgi:hypothetical protein
MHGQTNLIFYVHVTVQSNEFLYNKNRLDALISQIYSAMKLYMFRTVPLYIKEFIHCTLSNGICLTSLLRAFEQDQDGNSNLVLLDSLYDLCHCWVYNEKTPDDRQFVCPKHVEFHARISL